MSWLVLLACAPITPAEAPSPARVSRGTSVPGRNAVGVGDVDGDGFDDIAVATRGEVVVYRGSASRIDPSGGLSLRGSDASFGDTLAAAGDVDGDGFGDILVGEPDFESDGVLVGRVSLFVGSADGIVVTPMARFEGELVPPTDEFCFFSGGYGSVLAGVGDLDHDGLDDLLIGADRRLDCDSDGSNQTFYDAEVQVWLSPGAGRPWSQPIVADPDAEGRHLTSAVAIDLDGDGVGEVVLAGTQGDVSQLWIYPEGPEDPGVSSLATVDERYEALAAADLDGDGRDELVVGMTGCPTDPTDAAGCAAVLTPDLTEVARFPELPIDGVGSRLAALGDVNGDGFEDAGLGSTAREANVHGWLYFGSASGLSTFGSPLDVALSDGLDYHVAAGGDIDGDGFADVLVSGLESDTTDIFYGGADPDRDGDGSPASVDCDDADSGATGPAFYPDDDEDGFGDLGSAPRGCEAKPGMVTDRTDCDDSRPDVNITMPEVCDADSADEDCDGQAEEADSSLDLTTRVRWHHDVDGDGFGTTFWAVACHHAGADNDLDCDDDAAAIHPGAAEVCGADDVDDDCDGVAAWCDPDPGGRCGCSATPAPTSLVWLALWALRRRRVRG